MLNGTLHYLTTFLGAPGALLAFVRALTAPSLEMHAIDGQRCRVDLLVDLLLDILPHYGQAKSSLALNRGPTPRM